MHLERLAHVLRLSTALLFLAACQKSNRLNKEMGAPVDKARQTIALQSTEQLRAQWNGGACQVVYEQAAAHFRSQSLQDWLSQCAYLREKFGIWQSFISQEAITCGGPASIVCLDGIAVFGKERYEVIIAWTMETRQPRLLYLSLGQNEKAIETIPPPRQHLFDPPPPSSATRRG
jgi:hypothetical protein